MDCFFEARPISPDTLRQAYAVMLLRFPALSLPDFRKRVARNAHGVMTGLFDRRGYVHALFRSKVIEGEGRTRTLQIADLILSDAISSLMGHEMVDALMLHASQNGCDQLTVERTTIQQAENTMLGNMLENMGFRGPRRIYERHI